MARRGALSTPGQLVALAKAQGGLVLRSQAVESGVDYQSIRLRLKRGYWAEHMKCIAIDPRSPAGALRDAWAMALQVGEDSCVVSGVTALELSGVDLSKGLRGPKIALATDEGCHRVAGVLLRRKHPASRRACRHRSGIKYQDPTEAIIDILQEVSGGQSRDWCDFALQRRILSPADLMSAVECRCFSGRDGLGRLERAAKFASSGTQSVAERLMRELLNRAHIDGFVSDWPVRLERDAPPMARIDLAHPQLKIAVEVDGRAFHSGGRKFEQDRNRQNRLMNLGWHVLRVTWEMLTRDPRGVCRSVVEAIALRSSTEARVFDQ